MFGAVKKESQRDSKRFNTFGLDSPTIFTDPVVVRGDKVLTDTDIILNLMRDRRTVLFTLVRVRSEGKKLWMSIADS